MSDEPVPEEDEGENGNEPDAPVKERPLGVRLTGAAMRGLHRAIYGGQEDDIVIVADASGDPPSPDGLELHLDLDHPEASTVVVRRAPTGGHERRPPGAEGENAGGATG